MVEKLHLHQTTVIFFQNFLLEFIMEDIKENLNKRQLGGRKRVGTEHFLVNLLIE